jgi:hypothetical protein
MSLAQAANPYFLGAVDDATGISTTVATAGTPLPLLGALFTQRTNNLPSSSGSPGFLFVPATGKLTCVGALMNGRYRIAFTPSRVTGTNAGTKIFQIAKGGVVQGFKSTDVSAATAVETSMGQCIAVLDLVAGDEITVVCDVGTSGHIVTTRTGVLECERVA